MKALNKILKIFGYRIIKGQILNEHYVLHNYLDKSGNFDYDAYRNIQTQGNKRKLDLVWVKEENIRFLSQYIKTLIHAPAFGICHGTRRGKEQEWFAKHLGCKVIGTEISDTANQFPSTIQWDFHKVKPEWLGSVDFIYSNSFDHSFNPEECLTAWMSCLKRGGICILEHTSGHTLSGTSDLDPFGVDLAVFPYLILKWGKGKYSVREILDAPVRPGGIAECHFICIQNNQTDRDK
ncbi:MAG TPA: methyltransferase domain-containing protein [Verrucomicrobiae bacterium]